MKSQHDPALCQETHPDFILSPECQCMRCKLYFKNGETYVWKKEDPCLSITHLADTNIKAYISVMCGCDSCNYLRGLTWRCYICNEVRPDRYISVVKKEIFPENPGLGIHNIKYCNDREECITKADKISPPSFNIR